MMEQFNSYSEYCSAFRQHSRTAYTMFALRNWMIAQTDWFRKISNGNHMIGLDELKGIANLDMRQDMLSFIVHESREAFFRLFDHMCEKTARKNITMPVQKAKEINSASIIWLCRQPGRTVREKIANSNHKLMAVHRFISHDTPENRLLVACTRLLCAQICEKQELLGEQHCSDEELLFLAKANTFLHTELAASISKWNNTPPNNALLSDKNYKKIWNAWTKLKELDTLVKTDAGNIESNCFTLFKTELLAGLKPYLSLPQFPVTIDYDTYQVQFHRNLLYGCTKSGAVVRIELSPDCVKIICPVLRCQYQFEKSSWKERVWQSDDILNEVRQQIADMHVLVSAPLERSDTAALPETEKKYIDTLSVIPSLIDTAGISYLHNPKMIYQEFLEQEENGTEHSTLLSCFASDMLLADDSTRTYTICAAAEQERTDILQKIFAQLKKEIRCNTLTMMINDGYDAFQLKNFKKSARSCFNKVELFPESIGAVFWYQLLSEKFENYRTGNLIIVANVIGDQFSLTPVSSSYTNGENSRFIWERYPTALEKKPVLEEIKHRLLEAGCTESKAQELLNAFGLRSFGVVSRSVWFQLEGREPHNLNQDFGSFESAVQLDITSETDKLISEMFKKSHTKDQTAHVIVLSDLLYYHGNHETMHINANDVMRGALAHDKASEAYNSNMESSQHETLWRDHLPDLGIKRLLSIFPLVQNARTNPILGRKQKIEISSTFKLPAGKKEYHFKLIQSENGADLQYEAVIRNAAFPLQKDTICRLHMYYQYDADDVYTLEFVPVDLHTAEFKKAKVEFLRVTETEETDLPSPVFPPQCSWEELSAQQTQHLNRFESVTEWVRLALKNLEQELVARPRIDVDKILGGLPTGMHPDICLTVGGKTLLISLSRFNRPKDITPEARYISFKPEKNERRTAKIAGNRNVGFPKSNENFFFLNHYYLDETAWDVTVFFHKSKFKNKDEFSADMDTVSFLIQKDKEGRYIQDDKGRYSAYQAIANDNLSDIDYLAENIEVDTLYDRNYFNTKEKTIFSVSMSEFHKIYENGRSVYDPDCPEELRQQIMRVIDKMPYWYKNLPKLNSKTSPDILILNRMNIMSRDMNEEYRQIIVDVVRDCCEQKKKIMPDYIGYAMGNLTEEYQRQILNYILHSDEYWNRMDFFASNAWKSPQFIFNLGFETIQRYCNYSIDSIKKIIHKRKANDYKYLHWYMEFILACFRLRDLHDPVINQYLSLQNPKMKELYHTLEIISQSSIWIKTILNLQIKQENVIHDKLTYALACYLTGDMGEDEIQISGVDEDNRKDDENG